MLKQAPISHCKPILLIGSILLLEGGGSLLSNLSASAISSVSGDVDIYTEVAPAIAMTITGNADTDPGCGVANRYADALDSDNKKVDTFDGTEGGDNEVNTNTSCSKAIIPPSSFDTTSSVVTVYTNNANGYKLTVRATSSTDIAFGDNDSIAAGVLESETGGQGIWSYKTDSDILDWTAMTTTDHIIRTRPTKTTDGEATNVTYGISTRPNQAAGVYQTKLTYTATTIDGSEDPDDPIHNYSLSYNLNGGTGTISDQTHDSVSSTWTTNVSYTSPSKTGYNFKGWTTVEGSSTAEYQPGDSITISAANPTVTLYAVWAQAYTYAVTVNCGGGSGCDSGFGPISTENSSYSYNHTLSSGTPAKTGYTFTGYRSSIDSLLYSPGDTISLTSANRTATLTAEWAENHSYSIEYNMNGGSGTIATQSNTTTATSWTTTLSGTSPSRSGYNFKGWSTSSTATTATYQPSGSITVTTSQPNVVLYAVWAETYTYAITVNCNGGSNCDSGYGPVVTENSSYSHTHTLSSTEPTKSGYVFNGYQSSVGSTTYLQGQSVTLSSSMRQVTLTAQWVKTYTYSVSYNCQSGTGCPSNTNTTIANTSYSYTIPSTAPTRDGYNFIKYNTQSNGGGTDYSPGGTINLTSSSPSITLYAQWEEKANDFWSITTMQEMTTAICNTVYTPSSTTSASAIKTTKASYTATSNGADQVPSRSLRDTRDGKYYTVKKLADGNCWMTDNLKLTLSDGVPVEIANNTTGASAGTWTPTATTGAGGYNQAINRNTVFDNSTTHQWYYSWWAATAGSDIQTGGAQAQNSICPVGWKLPRSYANSSAKSFGGLFEAYGMSITYNSSATYPYVINEVNISALESQVIGLGRYGLYTSSFQNNGVSGTYYNGDAAAGSNNGSTGGYTNYSDSGSSVSSGGNRSIGRNIRCVMGSR